MQLLQVTPDVLCQCFLQTNFLHVSLYYILVNPYFLHGNIVWASTYFTMQHCFNNHVLPHFLDCYALHRWYWISKWCQHCLQSLTLVHLVAYKSFIAFILANFITLLTSSSLSVSAYVSPKHGRRPRGDWGDGHPKK